MSYQAKHHLWREKNTCPGRRSIHASCKCVSGALYLVFAIVIAGFPAFKLSAQTESNWILNANGNWGDAANWNPGIPNGMGQTVNFTNNITASRIITNNLGTITLGTLNFGTSNAGDFGYTIQTGTLRFENEDSAPGVINITGTGNSNTINSNIEIADRLDINVGIRRYSRGLVIGTTTGVGVISGGVNGSTTLRINSAEAEDFSNWVLLRGLNTFEGQILVESGHLRLESFISSAGARGVGNETIVTGTGRVDLRGLNFADANDETEIFMIEGIGANGLGALVNTTGTGQLGHLILTGDAMAGGQSINILARRRNTANNADIAPILDFGGNSLTKLGISELRIHNADLQNTAGAVMNVHEGILKFENRGALDGGGLIGGTVYGNNIDGMTFNVSYVSGAYDGVDPLNGSRTSDPFGPNRLASDTLGYAAVAARLAFRTDWTSATHALNTKVVDTWDNITINLSNGVLVREGNTEVGRTFDQTFGAGTRINLTGGSVGQNLITLSGGSSGYNTALSVYDHPGVTEIQGQIVNEGLGFTGEGFTVRGNRELRLSGDNADFSGKVLVKQNTGRYMAPNYTNASGAHESQFFNLVLSGENGGLGQAQSITLTRLGSLALLNSSAPTNDARAGYLSQNNNDRLNDNGILMLRNGSVYLETDAMVKNLENFGNVVADLGTNFLFLDTRAGGGFDGSFASFARNNGGILNISMLNGSHSWGTDGADDVRLAVNDASGIATVGADNPGGTNQRVVQGIFGAVMPDSFATRTGAAVTRSDYTMEQAYGFLGVGLGLMTLETVGGVDYLRPLRNDEFHVGGTPEAGVNWKLDRFISPVGGPFAYGDRNNYASRNVVESMAVNSLTIQWDALLSGQTMVNTERDYLIIEQGNVLTINSGIINFASLSNDEVTVNASASIRGGFLDMNGQAAIINSGITRHITNSNSGVATTFLAGNSAFMRSPMLNVTDLIKTGRNALFLDTWNDFTGNIYVSDQSNLVVRHSGALGTGAEGRELVVGGSGNFLLEYGVNIRGIDLRVSNSFDTTRVALRNEGATHSSWGGDIIFDTADGAGSTEFQNHIITARTNGTLSLYGNIYTANNANFSDSTSFNQQALLSTAIAESATLNLRGQVRDTLDGSLFRVGDTEDSATQFGRNHSMGFQMRGHDEINVNAFQQWDATGALFATQGYFRIMYDPNAAGLDGNGFQTSAASTAIAQAGTWNDLWLGGPQNLLGVGNSATNAYHSHLMLTKADQVLNWGQRVQISNNNRNHTLTIGGEHETGTAYIGSTDNNTGYRLLFQNSNTERDLRFLQVRGGTLVVNARLEDSNTTADSFNATVSLVGPGTVVFNRSTLGSSNVDRWNFMAGTAVWGQMSGNNQFARTRGTGTNALASISTWGGGNLIVGLDDDPTARTQTLDGDIYFLNGASSARVLQGKTLTLGAAARTLTRRSGATMAFYEDGTGAINISAASLTTTAGEFLAPWAVYGNSATGVTDWAGRQGTTGVQAFAGYAENTFGAGSHTNLTSATVLMGNETTDTLRFGGALELDIGVGNTLSLAQGGLLIPSNVTEGINIHGGSITSEWGAGSNDLLLFNFGQGAATIQSVITDNGPNKVNLVHAGSGTTVLTAANQQTGNIYLNDGVLKISSDAQLGQVNGSIAKVVLVGVGSGYTNTQTNASATLTGGGDGGGAVVTFNTGTGVVSAINVTNGGSGYTSGVRVALDGTPAGNNAGGWAILDSGNLHFDGGVLHATDSFQLNSGRTIFLGGNGGTLRVDPGKTLTIDGFISGEYNHAHTANGYTLADTLGNVWDASSVRNPDIGDLTIDGGGTVVFRYAPLGDGATPGNLAHVYGGITWINDGILRLEGVGTTGVTGALGTHRSFVDSTVIGANGTLDLFFTASDPSIQEWLTLRGMGYQGGGTISSLAIGTARVYNLAGHIHAEQDALINLMNGHSVYFNNGGGDLFGTGSIIRKGNGELRFYGNNPEWTGQLLLASGTTQLINSASLGGMTGLRLERNTFFQLDADSTTISEFGDRLPDDLALTSNGWTRIRLNATSGAHSGLEKLGVATVEAGVLGIEYNLGSDLISGQPRLTGDYAGWFFDEIVRMPGGVVAVRNLDAGTGFAGGAFGLSGSTTTNKAVLMVNTAPMVVGGDGSAFNHGIAPGFFGGTRELWVNAAGTGQLFTEEGSTRHLMTVEAGVNPETGLAVNYIRTLELSEYRQFGDIGAVNLATPDLVALDASAAGQNVAFLGRLGDELGVDEFTGRRNSTLSLKEDLTVNSLSFLAESYINGSAASRGNTTTMILNDAATLTINSGVLNIANLGVQNMNGAAHNTGINADIRAFIQGGRLDFNGNEAIINANNRWIHYNTSASPGAYQEVDVDNTQVFINSSIINTGGNGLTKTGPSTVYLQAANHYNGDTNVNHGLLYARHSQALGESQRVNVSGSGGFLVGLGAEISGVNVHVGLINGNGIVLAGEQSSIFNGNVIIDNVDVAGATGYNRTFVPRIYNNTTSQFVINGDIYGGPTLVNEGVRATESRMFSTFSGAQGILDFKGRIMDNVNGAIASLVTTENQNQVLRLEILDTTSENNVQLWQPYESAGRIRLLRGVLRFMGEGNFYSDDAIAAINPDNEMSGFQMGGRGVVNTAGTDGVNLALVLANAGSVFNLSSWEVGVESTDRDNITGNDNFNRGNTTGNRTLAGENRTGTVTFGTGTGGITFVNNERFGAYDAPLQLHAAPGGRVDMRVAFLDGGNQVNSSITKAGRGEVRLLGSSLGDSTVEAVNVLGGFLTLEGYDVNLNRRVGQGAELVLGGGGLVLNAGATAFTEDFGAVRINAGGSALVAVGAGTLNLGGSFNRQLGGQAHFQSISGGVIMSPSLALDSRLGSWATFGANATAEPFATDWAATNGLGQVVAFTGYSEDVFGTGLHTDARTGGLTGAATGSMRFDTELGTITSGSLVLEDGGLLITSNYGTGTPIGFGVGLSAPGDLILHNFATGDVTIAGGISGTHVVFNGTGRTLLTGLNSQTGTTFLTGAATVVVDSLIRFGDSGNFHFNGGTLEYTPGNTTELFSAPIVLGGNDGVIRVVEADGRLILRGAATNQITSEANVVASVTTNPFSGGISFEGSGTIQLGNRSAADAAQDVLGVNNAYTGLTVIGDGVNPVKVDIQGQVNTNGHITPFGANVGWLDGTLVMNNATVEFGQRRGDGSRNGQVRLREWFEWGASPDDVTSILVSTQREISLEGVNRINGTLEITVQNRNYSDMGTNAANAQTSLYFGLNEGAVVGDGRIIVNPNANPAGNTYGTVQFRESMPDFTGDIEVRNGYLAVYGQGYVLGTGTTPILFGSEGASNAHRADLRIFTENGTNGSATVTSAFDAPPTDLTFYRDIRVADNTNQDLRLMSGSVPANGFIRWTGNIDTGNSPGQTLRLYFEDTENLDPLAAGHQQQVVMAFSGNLSGNRNLLLDSNEGGDINQTLPVAEGGRIAADVHRAMFNTFLLSGDNSNYQGNVVVSAETSTTVIDKDDIPILRFGSDLALTAQNNVILQALSGLQAGGYSVTIGNLATNGGASTSGLYSFIDYDWAQGRQSLYDLDHVVGTNSGTNGKNISALGGSSEIIENASANPGMLTITQTVDAVWDAFFRDGRRDGLIDGSNAASAPLSVVKSGEARATLTIYNDFSGMTRVSQGNLQVGQGGNGIWGTLTQGSTTVSSALVSPTRLAGSTGTGLTLVDAGATLSGTGHVRGDLEVNGLLMPGDLGGTLVGTLFVGNETGGSLRLNAGSTTTLQLQGTPSVNPQLMNGVITFNNQPEYDLFIADIANLLGMQAEDNALNPSVFGGLGSHLNAGNYDHIEIGGDLAWTGGTITVLDQPGWVPQAGQIYNLLDWFGTADWTGINLGSNRFLVGNGDDDGHLILPDLSLHSPYLRWDTALFESHGVLFIASPFALDSAPILDTQPQSVSVFARQSVTFEVEVSGPGPMAFVWKRNGEPIFGAPDGPIYTITDVPLSDIGQLIEYTVEITNVYGSVESDPAVLTVATPIIIHDQPESVATWEGYEVTFSVTASGDTPFTYLWTLNGSAIPGATNNTLTVTAAPATAGEYRVRISNDYSTLVSDPAMLTLNPVQVVITRQPEAKILPVGGTLQLEVETEGGIPQTFQWRRNGRAIAGATQAQLEIPNMTTGLAGVYTCLVSNKLMSGSSSVVSSPAVVTVVNTEERLFSLNAGSAVTLSVIAVGHASDAMSYEWYVDSGTNAVPDIQPVTPAATARSLRLTNLPAGKLTYFCRVTTASGGVLDSGNMVLRVFNDVPSITQPEGVDFPTALVGEPYQYRIPLAEGAEAGEPDPLRIPSKFVASGLPRGLRIDNEGLIFGVPTAERRDRAGNVIPYDVRISASNARGRVIITRALLVQPLDVNFVGVFTGPVARDEALNLGLGGMINFTSTKAGAVSGRLSLGARNFAFRTTLVTSQTQPMVATSTVVINRARTEAPLTLAFSLDATTGVITAGTVTDGLDTASVNGWLNTWKVVAGNRTPAAAYAGYHTVGLNLPTALVNDLSVPQGTGYGSFTVSAANGRLTLAGRLADGTAITNATFVGPNGQVLVFRLLYTAKARGSLLGEVGITLGAENALNRIAGTVNWLRPANVSPSVYPAGFAFDMEADGGRYTPPAAGERVLGIAASDVGVSNAIVELLGANVETALPQMTGSRPHTVEVRVDERNRVVPDALNNPRKVTLTIVPRTGAFSGRFLLEEANPTGGSPAVVKRTITYQGMIINDNLGAQGSGYFMARQLPGVTAANLGGLVTFDKLP